MVRRFDRKPAQGYADSGYDNHGAVQIKYLSSILLPRSNAGIFYIRIMSRAAKRRRKLMTPSEETRRNTINTVISFGEVKSNIIKGLNSYIRDISPKQQNLRSCWLRRFFYAEMREMLGKPDGLRSVISASSLSFPPPSGNLP